MSLLPPNSTALEREAEGLADAIRDLPVDVRHLWNPQTCPAAFLPWLAWALSVDRWRTDWPEATKRAVIAASPRVHRLKGTVAAVRAAIAPFGEAIIREWFEDPAEAMAPRTFKVVVAPNGVLAAGVQDMVAAIEAAKPAAAHFTVEQAVRTVGGVAIGGFVRAAVFRRIVPIGAV